MSTFKKCKSHIDLEAPRSSTCSNTRPLPDGAKGPENALALLLENWAALQALSLSPVAGGGPKGGLGVTICRNLS